MKKYGFLKIGLILAIGLFFWSASIYSQTAKLTRQEKSAAKKMAMVARFQSLDTLLAKRAFVLEADFLEDQYGDKIPVPELINFIMVKSPTAVIQTGSNGNLGDNGVGGVTAEGSITKFEVTKNPKSLSYYLRFTMSTNIGFYDVSMYINSEWYARATISGNTRGKLIYDGYLKTLRNSGVFKGQSRY